MENYEWYEFEANWHTVEHLRALRWQDVQRVLDLEDDEQYPLFDEIPCNTNK